MALVKSLVFTALAKQPLRKVREGNGGWLDVGHNDQGWQIIAKMSDGRQ